MRTPARSLLTFACIGCCAAAWSAAVASDAPDEDRREQATLAIDAPDYAQALGRWRSAEDVNAWIAARFRYDMDRALALSETQRGLRQPFEIYEPAAFFAAPDGVCVDLSRFAVETLSKVDPAAKPRYLMIEFEPVEIAGNTLRRHWLAAFERDGSRYFFADSKRPGYIAGPYASIESFVRDYARYRGRTIVAFRELASYRKQTRKKGARPPVDAGTQASTPAGAR